MCFACRNHGFVSSQAFSEMYNSVFHDQHPAVMPFIQWQDNLRIGEETGNKSTHHHHFLLKILALTGVIKPKKEIHIHF